MTGQVNRLVDLANALLDLEELRGAGPIPREDVVPAELVHDAALAAVPAGEGVAVDADVTAVRVNRRWLELAVGNLVANALRHGAGTVHVDAHVTDGLLRVAVRDEGPGFPEDFAPHAFDRFSRAEQSRSTPGSGLGLALVRAVAEAHGGRAYVDPADRACVRLEVPTGCRARFSAHRRAASTCSRVVGKTGTSTSSGADEQLDLGAAEHDALGARADQPVDHLEVRRPRLGADHAQAQLVVDDPVHQRAVLAAGHQHLEAVAGQPSAVELLLHRERRPQQADGRSPARVRPPRSRRRDAAGDATRPPRRVGHLVHGVGAEHEQLGAPRLQRRAACASRSPASSHRPRPASPRSRRSPPTAAGSPRSPARPSVPGSAR